MNPMNSIRRRIAATTLANPTSLWQGVKRGAANGLRWGHLIAIIAVSIMVAALIIAIVVGVSVLIARYGVAPLFDARFWQGRHPWQGVGALLGFYVTTCAWSSLIGALTGGIVYAVRRRRTTAPSDKSPP